MSLEQVVRYTVQDARDEALVLPLRSTARGAILPAPGTRDRLAALRDYYRSDHAYLARGAIAGLAKRVASLPWTIRAPDPREADRVRALLVEASFGQGWGAFVQQLVIDFLRYDTGAFVEVVGEGDPAGALTGEVLGVATIDPLRCYPTGDYTYPVVYFDRQGRAHKLHYTRVLRLYDAPETDEALAGWGDCALARAIAIVHQQLLMNRYVEQALDDNPPPGILVASNLSQSQLDQAIANYAQQRETDSRGLWGRTLWLLGLDASQRAHIETVTFSQPPEKFDYSEYTNLHVDALALALGVDRQELWQLSSGSLGSGAQSEILNLKSRGKTIGYLIAEIERAINLLLPPNAEFAFEYRDESEVQQQAMSAQAWANAVGAMSSLTPDEQRVILAENVPGVRDVISDEQGRVQSAAVTDLTTTDDAVVDDVKQRASFTPNQAMREEAERGLAWRREYGRGGTLIGVARARDIANGKNLSLETVRRMASYFARHEVDKQAQGWRSGEAGYPSAGRIAWALWGGDAGRDWANAILARVDNEEKSASSGMTLEGLLTPPRVLHKRDVLARGYRSKSAEYADAAYARVERSFLQSFQGAITRVLGLSEQGLSDMLRERLAVIILRQVLERHGRSAYRIGLSAGGRRELNKEDERTIDRITSSQIGYVGSFAHYLANIGEVDPEQLPFDIAYRAALWTRSLIRYFRAGLAASEVDPHYIWKLGDAREHCKDCVKLHNQIHPYSEWERRGLLPKSDSLTCGGWCKCRLEWTDEPERGNFLD